MLNTIANTLEADLAKDSKHIPLFKQALATAREQITARFNDGEDTAQLIAENSAFMDSIIKLAWQRYAWTENKRSWRKTRICLIAVGGYGRSELLPNSDIDLLILLERNNHSSHRNNIQSFTTLLWDIGLEVGHSVRSLSECRAQSADVTVLTAMMESRTLVGDDELRQKMQAKIAPSKIWPAKKFFEAKREEQRERHEKSDHTEYSLEPNIKTSPGGLRDIQTLAWIAKREYDADSFESLSQAGIVTQEEIDVLVQARLELWKIRFALHLLTERDENRLLFEYQQQLANQFGYVDGDQLAVEQFMQHYYRVALRVNTINETLLQHFDEVIVQAGSRLQVRPLNDRFRLVNNMLEAVSEDVFRKTPSALLEMFDLIGHDDTIEGFRASTIRLAQRHVYLIDDDFRADPDNAAYFMSLLAANNHLFTQLRRMGRWGVLGRYLPEFGRVIGQMQFDLFHIYTVDAHTLQVVRNMRRFRYKNNEQQFPIAAHIHSRLPKIELLYIAGLYHDIAKGMGGDHSELGVDIAKRFCERHKLPNWDTNLVCWLVKNHLVMSTTAQRKDIQDPEVVHEFATLVGEQVRLDYIYALTVADMNATNPTLWNGWRASLLSQLYSETKKALRHGLEAPLDRADYIEDVQEQALNRLREHHDLDIADVETLWNQVDEDYFVRERVSDIVWHTDAILNHQGIEEPLILVEDDMTRRSDAGFTQVFVHSKNRKDLFVAIVTAIDQLGLTIVDARIATSATDLTFNTFTVLEKDGQPVGEKPARQQKIKTTIAAFLKKDKIGLPQNRRLPTMLKQFKHKTRISMSATPDNHATAVDILSPDRPGLLAVIASVFTQFEINLVSARITTLGERVEDVFYITDHDGNPLSDTKIIEDLQTDLRHEIDDYVETLAS